MIETTKLIRTLRNAHAIACAASYEDGCTALLAIANGADNSVSQEARTIAKISAFSIQQQLTTASQIASLASEAHAAARDALVAVGIGTDAATAIVAKDALLADATGVFAFGTVLDLTSRYADAVAELDACYAAESSKRREFASGAVG